MIESLQIRMPRTGGSIPYIQSLYSAFSGLRLGPWVIDGRLHLMPGRGARKPRLVSAFRLPYLDLNTEARRRDLMDIIASFVIALLTTTVLVPVSMRFAGRLGLFDAPDDARKVHGKVIPQSGGLAIIVGVGVATGGAASSNSSITAIMVCAIAMGLVGYYDDRVDLRHRWKFVAQFLLTSAFLVWFAGDYRSMSILGSIEVPLVISIPAVFLFIVGVTNSINLSDGLDGLAGGNSLLSFGLLAVLALEAGQPTYAAVALALVGGLLGFLRFNTHPAKVFMGDTGSQFLGFAGAAIAIAIIQGPQAPYSLFLPVLVFGLPILDTFAVMAARAVQGEPLFRADRRHIHHQLLDLGFRHHEVVLILYTLQAIAVVTAFFLRYETEVILAISYAIYCALVIAAIQISRTRGWQMPDRVVDGNERRNLWLRKRNWLYQIVDPAIAILLGGYLIVSALVTTNPEGLWPYTGAAIALVLLLTAMFTRASATSVSRCILVVASAFLAYSFLFEENHPSSVDTTLDLWTVTLACALVFAVRVTRKATFRIDTQDYLVLIVLCIAPYVVQTDIDAVTVGTVMIRFVVLLYACEYLLRRSHTWRWGVNSAGITSLVLVGF